MMDSLRWLHILHYDYGGQCSYQQQVQYSYIKGQDKIFCKRKYLIDVTEQDKFSHRTLFPFEIIIDLDNPQPNTELFIQHTHMELEKAKVEHAFFFSGNRGFHLHIFDKNIIKLSPREREEYRRKRIELITTDYDKMLLVDSHMIAVEFSLHWKSGKPKQLLYYYFEDRDIMQKIMFNVGLEL